MTLPRLASTQSKLSRTTCCRGFTLIELIVALAITGIILSIGIPGMTQLVLDNRRTIVVNDLMATLNNARLQAILFHRPVGVCRAATDAGSEPRCAVDTEGGWENGWLVFIDDDRDGKRSSEERLLNQHGPLSTGSTLRGNSRLADAIDFSSYGTTADNGRLVYCDRRGWSGDTRIVVLATTGRARTTTAALDNNTPLKGCMG